MIFITAKFQVLPEHAEAWPAISREFTEACRAEDGCLWFDWSRSLDDADEYVLVEAFRDGEAGAAHVNSRALQGRPAEAAGLPGRHAEDREQDGRPGRLVRAGRDEGRLTGGPMTRLLSTAVALLAALTLALTVAPADAAGQAWVTKAQQRLNQLGCQAGPADGELGHWTRSAVIRFQSRTGRAQTGKLDNGHPHAAVRRGGAALRRRPVPAGSGTGRRIVISQRQNWVWLVGRQGGSSPRAAWSTTRRCCTRGAHRTGSYCGRTARIKRNTDDQRRRLARQLRALRALRHRLPPDPDLQVERQADPPDWYLGTNMSSSHGCIRLSRAMSLQGLELHRPLALRVRVVRPTPRRALPGDLGLQLVVLAHLEPGAAPDLVRHVGRDRVRPILSMLDVPLLTRQHVGDLAQTRSAASSREIRSLDSRSTGHGPGYSPTAPPRGGRRCRSSRRGRSGSGGPRGAVGRGGQLSRVAVVELLGGVELGVGHGRGVGQHPEDALAPGTVGRGPARCGSGARS